MIAPPAAIHYHVTVTCSDQPCRLPVAARLIGGGGFPTPVPPTFTVLRLHIDPAPPAQPSVVWYSDDATIAFPSATSPFESTLRLPDDTAATPAPDTLQALLVPGMDRETHTIGMKHGETTIEADVGAPVNERVSIPVFANGSDVPPQSAHTYAIGVTPLKSLSGEDVHFSASITYAQPVAPTYGKAYTLVAEVPFAQSYGLTRADPAVQIVVSPTPYSVPEVTWNIDGTSATISSPVNGSQTILRGTHVGPSTLHAHVGAPANLDVSIPVVTYATLVLPCGHGVSISPSGETTQTTNIDESDIYLACGMLRFPGGAVLLTNGSDLARDVPAGVLFGPQFPEVGAGHWRKDIAITSLDLEHYRAVISPCAKPTGADVARIDYRCQTMNATTLLFRTRDGRYYVKWLLQTGNGLNLLAGPYQTLFEGNL